MATIGFQLAYGNPTVVHIPETTTASSFVAGDIVRVASGYVGLCADDDTCWGIAGKAASGTLGTSIPVYVLTPESTWIAELDTTSTTTHLGQDYAVNIGTAGSMSVDVGGTGSVIVIDFFEPVNTATGKVLVKFSHEVCQALEI
jgi:hypothetical protein